MRWHKGTDSGERRESSRRDRIVKRGSAFGPFPSFYTTSKQLQTHVIRSTQSLHLLRQSPNVAGGHQSAHEPRAARRRHGARDANVARLKVEIVVGERVGVGTTKSELTSLGVFQSEFLRAGERVSEKTARRSQERHAPSSREDPRDARYGCAG